MPSPVQRATHCVLIGAACTCMACGATGLDWVSEAHLESASQQRVNVVHASSFAAPSSGSIPATAEPAARPRLNHTVTLGEIDVAVAQAGPEQPAAPTVVVNNYNQVNLVAPAYGFGNYGYARGPARFSPGYVTPYRSQPAASSPLPGQSWPAVADHGPSFPYHAAPASPWTRTQ